MVLRDLVTGSNECAPSDTGAAANPLTQLANQLLGLDVKGKQHSHKEVDQHVAPGQQSTANSVDGHITAASSSLLQAAKGKQAISATPDLAPTLNGLRTFQEMNQHEQQLRHQQAAVGGLHGVLRTFLASGQQQRSFETAGPSTGVQLSVSHQCRIRDRTTILARQMYSGQGEQYADMQVDSLLHSLAIQPEALPSANHAHPVAFHHAWRPPPPVPPPPPLATAVTAPQPPLGDSWAAEFYAAQNASGGPTDQTWAHEFSATAGQLPLQRAMERTWVQVFTEQSRGHRWVNEYTGVHVGTGDVATNTWAEEYGQVEGAVAGIDRLVAGKNDLVAESWQLHQTLVASGDPKMRQSRFVQLLAKMTDGQLMIKGNALVGADGQPRDTDGRLLENGVSSNTRGNDWAAEFLGPGGSSSALSQQAWVSEFLGDVEPAVPSLVARGARTTNDVAVAADVDWVGDYTAEIEGTENAWVQQFLAEIGAEGIGEGHDPALQSWLDEFTNEQATFGDAPGSDGAYMFSPDNPYLKVDDPFSIGQQLFKDGNLAEAALALEAVLQREPNLADVWRLLGTVHAENEDDQLAIKAMMQGLAADPKNLSLLLALGVSYTNELDTHEAAAYLHRWLQCHPLTSVAVTQVRPPEDSSQWLQHLEQVLRHVLSTNSADPDVHTVLGVLQHLRCNYAAAAEEFSRALELRPEDYSLWNKLGATYANAGNSERATTAYQQSLQLKPNYVRAWTNLGVSYSNMGRHRDAAKHYAKALARNPQAKAVWRHLRSSAVLMGSQELMRMAEQQDAKGLGRWLGELEDGLGPVGVPVTVPEPNGLEVF